MIGKLWDGNKVALWQLEGRKVWEALGSFGAVKRQRLGSCWGSWEVNGGQLGGKWGNYWVIDEPELG